MKKEIECCDNCGEDLEDYEINEIGVCKYCDKKLCPDCKEDHVISEHEDEFVSEFIDEVFE